MMQEEVVDAGRKADFRRPDGNFLAHKSGRGALPGLGAHTADESKQVDATRVRTADDKLVALRAFRRAKGLCMHCAEKWSKEHRCPPTVQLHDCHFYSDMKILDLSYYDLIVGMDWLEAHSPMKVHWLHKWMAIPYHNDTVVLQGVVSELPVGSVVEVAVISISSLDFSKMGLHQDLVQLLTAFAHVFDTPTGLPPSRACDHAIPLFPGASPVHIRPYRYPPAVKDEIERQITEMLKSGIIQQSTSAFSSPVLLVKKDSTWRFCVDFRHLNAITVKTSYPVPIIEELLDELGQASWFSSLDLTAGYHQILLQSGEGPKTAFQTHSGHYEFRVMAFGLSGAPATFQKAMNSTLAPYLRKFVLVFSDDILIYSKTFEDHLQHIQLVLELLAKDQWKVKFSKCTFAAQQIAYLGHIISSEGVATDPSKISAVSNWPTPQSVKALRSFLGLAGVGTLFIWAPLHEEAFQALKNALVTAPVLALPDFSQPFCIETDASGVGVGAVLMQRGHPLAYLSKALGPRTMGLSAYEKEYLAILIAVDQWRHYLQLGEFILAQRIEQRLHTPWQQKVFTKLLGLQYKVIYKKGVDNRVADALSRHSFSAPECVAISVCEPQWITEITTSYVHDPHCSQLLTKLALNPAADPNFTLVNGVLRYKNRIWIGHVPELHTKVVKAFHSSAVGGHSGIPVTLARLKQLFAWHGMNSTVKLFVQSCQVCQQAKPDRARAPGLLQPLEVPTTVWEIISMDFVEGLPVSNHYNCILVVVDVFSKYAHFIALRHPFTAASVARAFHDQVYKHHGLPQAIVSDRDRIFLSQFWHLLFKLADVQLRMISAYHPQSDGQTERVNQCLETFLRCFVHACPQKWSSWLSVAQYATGRAPFHVLYGRPPHQFGISDTTVVAPAELSSWLNERQLMTALIKQHLERAKVRMKKQADKGRSEREFQVSEWVFLKLQPYVESSLAPRANQKLAFKFFGPYQILARVGKVAYKLQLPSSALIHPVFHVSQLKKAVGTGHTASVTLPDPSFEWSVPIKILDRRSVTQGVDSVLQVLVQWSHMPESLATWEDADALQQQFPRAAVWSQAASQGGGNVSISLKDNGAVGQEAEDVSTMGREPARMRRARTNNRHVFGPEWLNVLLAPSIDC
ncbi:hypothetical protein U9M48_041234 [Paspalum notatum var. saurae]|uniref:Uncharacterized protein n=1 Tax=Paspalum notatum var. saurae TaxID=547442 RepID=A0AAQ3XDZ7_PASNO